MSDNQETKTKKTLLSRFHFTSVSQVDKIFFVQNLHTMLRAGFPLAKALDTLSLQTKNKEFKKIILDIKQQIEKGTTFYLALTYYQYIFGELFVNLIEAGEISGKLEQTLNHLLVQMKKSYNLHKKIKNALLYPCIILTAMVGVGTAMMIFVLPNLIAMYSESNFTLPWPTRLTLFISNFITQNGLIIGVILVLFISAFFIIISGEKGKFYWHKFLLKMPIISPILIKINLANLTRTLNSLISTDIPITEDFKIIAKTVNNRVYRNYLLSDIEHLSSGESIYNLFKQRPDLFPPVVTQMINVGESSGTIDNITKELAEFYEEEVSDTMANLTVIIEPIVMLVIGAAVAFVAVSVIYPIYALVDQI
ncbi:MAG: type II secretion system F family protein [Patescibacteria group bacterium]